jgi:hypothetical protein
MIDIRKAGAAGGVASLLALGTGLTIAHAATNSFQDAHGVYWGCANNSSGELHLINNPVPVTVGPFGNSIGNQTCNWNETLVSWNAQGVAGTIGTNGTNGSNGKDGAQGPAGPAGAKGDAGASGTAGIQGIQGPQGLIGLTGLTGLTGPIGPTGLTGAAGDAGVAGTNGVDGTNGTDGANGADGNTILSGYGAPDSGTGNTGDFYLNLTSDCLSGPLVDGDWGTCVSLVGLAGVDGKDGKAGTNGTNGAAGAQGIQGLVGLTGANGKDAKNAAVAGVSALSNSSPSTATTAPSALPAPHTGADIPWIAGGGLFGVGLLGTLVALVTRRRRTS